MLQHHIRLAFRSLRRARGYSAINVAGLSIGLACCLLVALYLHHETRFDKHQENLDRLYRIVTYGGFGEPEWGGWPSGDPTAQLRDDMPGVENAVKLNSYSGTRVSVGDYEMEGMTGWSAEPSVFDVLTFHRVGGDLSTALDRPNTVVINRTMAERFFGEADAVGQSVTLMWNGDDQPFEVTAVVEDLPTTSHIPIDYLISYRSLDATSQCQDCGQPMFVLLKPNGDPEAIADRVLTILRDDQKKSFIQDVALQPVSEVYFGDIAASRQADRTQIYLLGIVGLIVLLIACSNYVNLATARALERAREVGVRKAVGAGRGQIVAQMVVETLMLTLIALPVGLGLLALGLPLFNTLADSSISLGEVLRPSFVLSAVGVLLAVGVLAGGYPSLVLSRFRPTEALRGRSQSRSSGAWTERALRRGVVALQFTATIVLLGCTLVISQQMRHLQRTDLGFAVDEVVTVDVSRLGESDSWVAIKSAFQFVPGVASVSASSSLPGQIRFSWMGYGVSLDDPEAAPVMLTHARIDEAFLETMNIDILAGRNIKPIRPMTREEMFELRPAEEAMLSESAVTALGFATNEEALADSVGGNPIVGIVADIRYGSLRTEPQPLMLTQNWWPGVQQVAVRLETSDVSATMEGLEAAWSEVSAGLPFEARFLRDDMQALYEQERRMQAVLGIFAGLAILIAALGLLGLAAFAATRRTKEIGIRKSLGATVASLVALLTREFVILVALAFALGGPLAYLAMRHWLDGFAVRVGLGPAPFVLAGVVVLGVAMLAAGLHAVRAARLNPANTLRHE